MAAYVIFAINVAEHKDVLCIEIGETESAKYWIVVLNFLKSRGFKGSVTTAFTKTEFQPCIIHQVRNTMKYVSAKDRKEFASYFKKITLLRMSKQPRQSMTKLKKNG